MGYTPAELDAYYGGTLPDLLGPGLRLLFVGINPGLHTVAVQAPFARPGNRFYPALHRAGITDRVIDASTGLLPADRAHLIERGIGLTTLVAAATRRADELTRAQLVEGAASLEHRVAGLRPTVVAMLGVTASRRTATRSTAAGQRPARRPSSSAACRSGWCRTPADSMRTRPSRPSPRPTERPPSRRESRSTTDHPAHASYS